MKQPDTTLPATSPVGDRDPSQGKSIAQALLPCLVFSAQESRRTMLARAMADAGWAPIVCDRLEQISVQGSRVRVPLAIVDLVGGQPVERQGRQTLCERLLSAQKSLLAVCGHEGDAAEEIWARQIGAWLYLPGLGEEEDLAQFASEARNVVEKLFPEFRGAAASSADAR